MSTKPYGRVVVAALALGVAGLSVPACGGGDDGSPTGSGVTEPTGGSTVPGPATTVPANSDSLVSVLGPPDTFSRELRVLDGQPVVVESYTYGAVERRFDLVGGTVVGSEAIDPFPDGTLFPLQYHLNEVWPGSTRADLANSLEGVELTEIDGVGLGLPDGATVLAGAQLVIGVLDDVVIYIETFALVPDADGSFEAYMNGDEP